MKALSINPLRFPLGRAFYLPQFRERHDQNEHTAYEINRRLVRLAPLCLVLTKKMQIRFIFQ